MTEFADERAGLPPYRYERPVANEYGRLRMAGGRLVCHLCGRDWLHLGTHAWLTHGMTAEEYRAEFGLNRGTPLVAESVRRRLVEHGLAMFRVGRVGIVPCDADGMRELRTRNCYGPTRLETRLTMSATRSGKAPKLTCGQGHQRTLQSDGGYRCRTCDNASAKRNRHPLGRFYGPPKPRSMIGDLCSKGHPWDGYTVKNWNGNPRRACRQCNRDGINRWRLEHPDKFQAQRAKRRKVR